MVLGVWKARAEKQEADSAIILDDFSRVLPASAISDSPGSGQWHKISVEGRPVLYTNGTEQLPELTYPLDANGFYDIYIGLVEAPSEVDTAEWQGIHAKLTSDPWYSHIFGGRTGLGSSMSTAVIDEIYWKRADLTNEKVLITQPYGRFFRPAGGIAYIKLVPVSTPEAKRKESALREMPKKSVGGMADYWSYVFGQGNYGEDFTRRLVDNYKNAGFDTLYFMINSDGMVTYPSKAAQMYSHKDAGDPRSEAKDVEMTIKTHDPVKVASEYSREQGIKFIPYFRVTNEQTNTSEYAKKFEALKIIGADGQPTRWPSLAYPEVREYKLGILRELLTNYSTDGLLLDFQRTMPVIGYEPPVVNAYREKYGVNPLLDVAGRSDPRWKQFRADVVTGFVRDVKKMVDEAATASGRPMELVVRVTGRDNLWKGLDVESWIKEGLIDVVIPSSYSMFGPVVPVKPFLKMAEGTKCKVYPCINPFFAGGDDDSENHPNKNEKDAAEIIIKRVSAGASNLEYAETALHYWDEGADGVVFYEAETLTAIPPRFPGRDGLTPMFQSLASPARTLDYVNSLEKQTAAESGN